MPDKTTTTDSFEATLIITKNGNRFATYAWHDMDRKHMQAFQRANAEALLDLGDKAVAA